MPWRSLVITMGRRPTRPLRCRMLLRAAFLILALLVWATESLLSSFHTPRSCRLAASSRRRTRLPSSANTTVAEPVRLYRREPQTRRPHRNRRPRNYWANITNLEREIAQFWRDRRVPTEDGVLLVPSESLLYHYHRHDLRGAIASHGGRRRLRAEHIRVRLVPGRWAVAVRLYPQLLAADPALSSERPPWHPAGEETATDAKRRRWRHSGRRKPHGFWNTTTLFKELFNYTYTYRENTGRPGVWMPRPSELIRSGREDLARAMARLGGYDHVCELAGLVPFREWAYFEGQLDMLLELKRYCDIYHDGDYTAFPKVSEIAKNGYKRLYAQIQHHGGRKFLSARLGMALGQRQASTSTQMLNYGAFDLDVAVQLLLFVRSDQARKRPPVKHRVIAMPSATKLRDECKNGEWIHTKILEFGGYENVARRLGLAISSYQFGS